MKEVIQLHPHIFVHRKNAKEYRLLKEHAYHIVCAWIAHLAPRYGVFPRRVSIRNQKTRWGSCTKSGSLSFNYKIALLPQELQKYLVVHELCHLIEFNHSPKFWELVAKELPLYRLQSKSLSRRDRRQFI